MPTIEVARTRSARSLERNLPKCAGLIIKHDIFPPSSDSTLYTLQYKHDFRKLEALERKPFGGPSEGEILLHTLIKLDLTYG